MIRLPPLFVGALALGAAAGLGCSSHSSGNGNGTQPVVDASVGSDAGDGGDAGDGAGGDPFVGSWLCLGTESFMFTKPSGAAALTTNYTTNVTIVSDGEGADGASVETVTSEEIDGGPSCVLKSTVSGDTATLESGQSCTKGDGTTADYTSGTSVLTGSTFTNMRAFTFSGTITVTHDGGSTTQVQVAGTGTSSGTCTKE